MQINKIQGTGFGKLTLDSSALNAFKQLPEQVLPEMVKKASELHNTKYWDLLITKHPTLGEGCFYPIFIRKGEQEADITIPEKDIYGLSCCYRDIGFENRVLFHAKCPYPSNPRRFDDRVLWLEFASNERAIEVRKTLKNIPLNNRQIFNQAVEITKILEESSEYKVSSQKKQPSLWNQLCSFFK